MTVTVSIPTIFRTYTEGKKRVEATGSTLAAVIDDLDASHAGIKDRLVEDGKLRRFVNLYVNDEDVRFSGGLDTPVGADADVTILPAVAGGNEFNTVAGG